MIAVRLHGPRNLRVEELPEPRSPGKAEALIHVDAVGICGSDLHVYLDGAIGDTKVPAAFVPGHEFAGTVVAAGDEARDGKGAPLKPGTRVAVDPAQPCGMCELCLLGHPNLCTSLHFCGLYPDGGCLCERIVVPATTCFPLPDSIDAETGALLEPLGVALHALSLSKARTGQSAVIIGAGPIGLLILQAAKAANVGPVFVVEQLPWRLRLAEQLGGIPIDSARTDARAKLMVQTLGRGVDVAFEAAWADESIQLAAQMTRHGGKLVLVGIPRDDRLALQHSTARRKGLSVLLSRRMKHTYPQAIRMVERGEVSLRQLVTHRFQLEKTPEAFALNADYLEEVVKVMITVQ